MGLGTIFNVFLPASDVMTAAAEARQAVAASGWGFKILLMDDEEAKFLFVSWDLMNLFPDWMAREKIRMGGVGTEPF